MLNLEVAHYDIFQYRAKAIALHNIQRIDDNYCIYIVQNASNCCYLGPYYAIN